MADHVAARLKVRDDLLDAVVAKLERRRDTRAVAGQVRRIVSLIASLEASERGAPDFAEYLTQVVSERIVMFRVLTEREKPPSSLRTLRIKLEALTSTFRTLQQEAPLGSRKQAEWWRAQIAHLWGHAFLRRTDAPHGP